MGVSELQAALVGLRRVCLDTPIFAYHLAEHPRYVGCTAAVLRCIEDGVVEGLTTTITLTELLSYPAQKGDLETMREWELYLTHFPNLTVLPLDEALASEAARVRGETRLKTPDAIQVAAARLYRADAIVSNDLPWSKRVTAPRVIQLEDFIS